MLPFREQYVYRSAGAAGVREERSLNIFNHSPRPAHTIRESRGIAAPADPGVGEGGLEGAEDGTVRGVEPDLRDRGEALVGERARHEAHVVSDRHLDVAVVDLVHAPVEERDVHLGHLVVVVAAVRVNGHDRVGGAVGAGGHGHGVALGRGDAGGGGTDGAAVAEGDLGGGAGEGEEGEHGGSPGWERKNC